MDEPNEPRYLTLEQVAELKQVSVSTVKRATASGILKNHRVKTKKNQQRFTRRYLLTDVLKWRATIVNLADDNLSDNPFLKAVIDPAPAEPDSERLPEKQKANRAKGLIDWLDS